MCPVSRTSVSRVVLTVIGSAPDATVAKIAVLARANRPSSPDRAAVELPLLNELFQELQVERLRMTPFPHPDALASLKFDRGAQFWLNPI
jgi:hypothetical protein